MKIALLTPYDLASRGGVNTHTRALAGWLREQGHGVDIAGPSSNGEERDPGVRRLGRPWPVSVGGTRAPLTLGRGLGQRVRKFLRDGSFDVVHVQEPFLPAIGWHAVREAAAPVVVTYHSSEAHTSHAYALLGAVLRRWDARFDLRIVASPVARSVARPVTSETPVVVPPCFEIDRFAPDAAVPASGAVPRHDERPVILFVGRDEPRKGLPLLIRAFARLSRRIPAQLWVVGELRASTRALARSLELDDERVHFLGPVADAVLPAYYQTADVLCSPALSGESLGLVLIEAMASGTPVVASEIAGYRYATRNGTDALLVAPRSASALAAGLERSLLDSELRHALTARGLERAVRFRAAEIGREHLELYDEARKRRSAAGR